MAAKSRHINDGQAAILRRSQVTSLCLLPESGERPPAKAGGFGLRLKAGSIGHSAD